MMKLSFLVESDKPAADAAKEIRSLLEGAGYDVSMTWPDIDPLIKRVGRIRDEVKKIK